MKALTRSEYPIEYTVPDYRRVHCDDCKLAFDSHKQMFETDGKCPKCGKVLR